tara:strand:+ start:2291 stop:2485 length:195 start_codon:yes stop_codon:yes gene_type:complete
MEQQINDKYDFVIGTLQVCSGIIQKMKSDPVTKYPMQVGLLTEMISSLTELREEIQKHIDTSAD